MTLLRWLPPLIPMLALVVAVLQTFALYSGDAKATQTKGSPDLRSPEETLFVGLNPTSNVRSWNVERIVLRSLFRPDRGPLQPPPEAKAVAVDDTETIQPKQAVVVLVPKLNAQLIGVIAGPSGERALLMVDDTKQEIWLAPGQALEGWVVETIDGKEVVMRHGEQAKILTLLKN